MTIVHLLRYIALLLLGATTIAAQNASQQMPTPNVIFILADDLGYGDLSSYGNNIFKTPNIDRLAQQGIRFTDAHVTSGVCTPSRYSLLTGRYCWRTFLKRDVIANGPALIEPGHTTIASLFQEHGYQTAAFGKWHVGFTLQREVDYNQQPVKPGANEVGFNYSFLLPVGHFYPPYLYLENGHVLNYNPSDPVTIKDAHQIGGKSYSYNPHEVTPELIRRTVDYIKQNHDRNFFIYLATPNVHDPLSPSAGFSGNPVGLYGDYINELDWAVGQILNTLNLLHLETNTLVLFSSDNGASEPNIATVKRYYNPNGSLRGDKGDLYEGGQRIPLIARWPNHIPSAEVSSQFIILSDFVATFASLLNRHLSEDEGPDGNNMLPALYGAQDVYPNRSMVIESRQGMFGLRKGHWMYLHGADNGDLHNHKYARPSEQIPDAQLYNLSDDLHEDHNLVKQEPEIAESMRKLLAEKVGSNLNTENLSRLKRVDD